MKILRSAAYLAAFFAFVLVSCDEENEPAVNGSAIAELFLESDAAGNQVLAGQTVRFTVLGDDGADYTNAASISINGLVIGSNQFQFTNAGTFAVVASLDEVSSNSLQVQVLENEQLSIQLSATRALRNQPVELDLVDSSGNSSNATVTYKVNGVAIEGNSFSEVEEGVYEVSASYEFLGQTYDTDAVEVEVFVPKRTILFEDYTGTWCPYCTHMLERIEYMKEDTEHLAVVSIHVGGSDPWVSEGVDELIDYFEVLFVPTGFSNRQYFFGFLDDHSWAIQGAGEPVGMALSIDSAIDGDQLNIDVSVISEEALENNKIVVMVLESELVWDQASDSNNDPDSPYYQLGNPIPDFVHDDVLRATLTDMLGDPIPNAPAFEEYQQSFSYTIPSNLVKENLSVVAFVVNSDNQSINAQTAPVGEFQPYD